MPAANGLAYPANNGDDENKFCNVGYRVVEGFGFNSVKCAMYWPELVGDVKRFADLEVQVTISSKFYDRNFLKLRS